jgi:hypothetical protein
VTSLWLSVAASVVRFDAGPSADMEVSVTMRLPASLGRGGGEGSAAAGPRLAEGARVEAQYRGKGSWWVTAPHCSTPELPWDGGNTLVVRSGGRLSLIGRGFSIGFGFRGITHLWGGHVAVPGTGVAWTWCTPTAPTE